MNETKTIHLHEPETTFWYNNQTLHIVLLVFVSSVILFPNIINVPLNSWDEARHAVNALEMINSGNWITTTYNNVPDMANIKFPLGAWFIAINYKLFGINEFSVRLWSVIFTVLTTVVIYLWGSLIKNRWLGLVAALIFISSAQVVGIHAGATGDYDAGASFFMALSLFLFTVSYKTKKKSYLFFSMIAVGIGTMYKSFMPGFLPLAIIFICLLFSKEVRRFLSFKNIIICTGIIAAIVSPWLVARSISDSSFVLKLLNFDYWNRLTIAVDDHSAPFWYYLIQMRGGFYPWIYFLPLGLFFVFKIYKKDKNKDLLFLLVSFFLTFSIFSIAATKNIWYILPLFPIMAIIAAITWATIWVKFLELRFSRILLSILTIFLIINVVLGVLNSETYLNAQIWKSYDSFSALINQEYVKKELLSSDVIVNKTVITQSNLFYLKKLLGDRFTVNSEIPCDLNKNQLWIVDIAVDSLPKFIEHCPNRKILASYYGGKPDVVHAIIK